MKVLIYFICLCPSLVFAKNMTQSDFKSVVNSIKKEGYYKVSEHDIYQAAIEGVLHSLEKKTKKAEILPPFKGLANELMPPRRSKEAAAELNGNVSGIGITINFDPKEGHQYPVIEGMISGSGAEASGILKNDQILKVNGKSVSQFKSFSDLVYGIRGPVGTKVKLHILRDGDVLVKNVQRVKLDLEPFEVDDLDPSTIYIEIGLFSKKTIKKLTELVSRASVEKKSLVIDVSDCSGGLFYEGLKALELFAEKNEEILVTTDRRGKKKVLKAKSDGVGKDLDIILITGTNTKSVAEAFAGSVRLLTGAMIVGQKTYGKATMESLIQLKNGYSVKFTVGQMNLPQQKTWNKKGIVPDIPVAEDEESDDVILQVVKKLLKRPS